MEFFQKIFGEINYTKAPLKHGVYESCHFLNCDFSSTSLSGIRFVDCEFTASNLSNLNLDQTGFQDVVFKHCKMLGLRFDHCNKFGLSFSFEKCTLDHSSFYQCKIPGTHFRNSQLHEVDFTEADLTGAVFENTNLIRAIFENTLLERADFTTASGYAFDPEKNRIRKAQFSMPAVIRLLEKYGIDIKP